jgi:hypothetical protein
MDRKLHDRNREGAEIYCPRCRKARPRREWRRLFRHIRRGAEQGEAAEVLRHQSCDEIVYVLIE